uniref:B12-binding domain-containing radical SAM protein n=1 Tax=candidate division WOR-3 bacterium TaxID=2052148 RepID=A0A7C4CCL0_UNCW3
MRYVGNIFRPPSEADSLLIQATIGCAHNRCTFCAMYREKEFRVRRLEHVLEDIELARRYLGPGVRRVFLCDGNALVLPTGYLLSVLERLKAVFPELQRVGIYANARDLLHKSEAELEELARHRLTIFYIGMESGSDRILKAIDKGVTAAETIAAVQKGMAAGMKASVIYLLGLGGRQLWQENAIESARAVSRMNPNYLSALTLTVIPGTPLAAEMRAGRFELPAPEEFALELKLFLEHVDVKATVFRSNHASNYVPLGGRLPADREKLVSQLAAAISTHRFKPEFLRGL